MWRFLRHPLDPLSLALGFLLGLAFQVLLRLIHTAGTALLRGLERWRASRQAETSTRFEQRYARWLQNAVRGWHLAAPLFALDEVLLPPRLLPSPPAALPEGELLPDDIVTLTVPYSPEWPQMSAFYQAPTLTLPQALRQGANLLLIGPPGAGKTTALLYLAWLVLQREETVAFLGSPLPLYLHVGGVDWAAAETVTDEPLPLTPLLQALPPEIPEALKTKLSKALPTYLQQGQVLLLLDGLDELPLERQRPVARYFQRLLAEYPQVRMVAAAAPDFYDGLVGLGLTPVAVAPWNAEQARRFLERWGRLWAQYIAPALQTAPPAVDPLLLNQWLLARHPVTTPLELTLLAWAAYAGDLLGPSLPQALEAYLRRLTPEEKRARPALHYLALELLAAGQATLPRRRIGRHLDLAESEAEEPTTAADEATADEMPEPTPAEPAAAPAEPGEGLASSRRVRRLLPELHEAGLLAFRGEDEVGFAHPTLWAYLAGEALAHVPPQSSPLAQGPWWAVKTQTLRFAVAFGAGAEVAMSLAEADHPPLYREPRWAAQALPDAPHAPWKVTLLRRLADWVANPLLPLGLRADALTALALSSEKGLGALFRRLLGHPDPSVRRLAALGCGLVRDLKAVDGLRKALDDDRPEVQRAAALALVALGTEEALTAVAELLLRGSDPQRRMAAEALANHPPEGYPTLQEGAQVDDLLVRRAVVYGLARVPEPWARDLLAHLQVEDDEWVVRSAAAQVMESLEKPSPFIPRPHPPLHNEPWLIAFAAEREMGVPPGEGALEVLRRCLREGDEAQTLAALERIVYHPDHDWQAEVVSLLEQGTPEQQEAAFLALRHLAAAGVAV